MTSSPFLPVSLGPQQSTSLAVTFTPSQPGPFTGRLQIGSDNFQLSGSGAGLLVSAQGGPSPAGGTIVFPLLPLGQQEAVQVSIQNTGSTAASVPAIGLASASAGFQVVGSTRGGVGSDCAEPGLQFQRGVRAEHTRCVRYRPDNREPDIHIVRLRFGSRAVVIPIQRRGRCPAAVSATLSGPDVGFALSRRREWHADPDRIGFQRRVNPAVQFSTGGHVVAFTIPAYTSQAVFPGGATQIRLQTGTVAGSFGYSAELQHGLNESHPRQRAEPDIKCAGDSTGLLRVADRKNAFHSHSDD